MNLHDSDSLGLWRNRHPRCLEGRRTDLVQAACCFDWCVALVQVKRRIRIRRLQFIEIMDLDGHDKAAATN